MHYDQVCSYLGALTSMYCQPTNNALSQTTLSLPPPLMVRPVNEQFGIPGSVNEAPLGGFPTTNAINLSHPNANLGLVTPQQQTVTPGPSTGQDLQIAR